MGTICLERVQSRVHHMNTIPVSGYLLQSNGDDPLHSHNLYITTWDGQPVHTHESRGVTSFDVGHNHRFAGTTEPAPSGGQHIHRYFTFTSFDDGPSTCY